MLDIQPIVRIQIHSISPSRHSSLLAVSRVLLSQPLALFLRPIFRNSDGKTYLQSSLITQAPRPLIRFLPHIFCLGEHVPALDTFHDAARRYNNGWGAPAYWTCHSLRPSQTPGGRESLWRLDYAYWRHSSSERQDRIAICGRYTGTTHRHAGHVDD